MFAAEDCAIDAVDALIEATFVSLEGPAEVRLFRFSARACLDDAWAVANLGNLGCDDPYGGGGRRYVFGGGGAICAVVGASAGSGWFAEAEPAPSEIDSHATSHVSVRAPPPPPDDDASARTSAASRESSFRGSFRGSFRSSSRGSLYRGGSSRGSMRKRLTMKRTSTILEPFVVPCRAAWKSNLQPDFNVRVIERFDTSTSAVLRELAESNRFVQKSAESTSI